MNVQLIVVYSAFRFSESRFGAIYEYCNDFNWILFCQFILLNQIDFRSIFAARITHKLDRRFKGGFASGGPSGGRCHGGGACLEICDFQQEKRVKKMDPFC